METMMSECTCPCLDQYRLLAYEHAAELQVEVNRLMSLGVGWRLHGELQFFNGGYRREMIRVPDNRPWLIPHHSPPVQR